MLSPEIKRSPNTSKWDHLIEGAKKERLKKVKALVDRPGMPGEKRAAQAAYKRLLAELEPSSKSKVKPTRNPHRKASRLWGPGGMDYESAEMWQSKLDAKGILTIRFVSEWSKSKWKRLHAVTSLRGKALLSISDPSGSNKTSLLMDRAKLGRYGIEFHP